MSQSNGHPKFYKYLEEMAELHSSKNADYAENNRPLGNFDRVGELCEKYDLFNSKCPANAKVAIIYMLKQFDCFMNAVGKNKELKTEGLNERLKDVCVYSILIRILLEEAH